MCNRETGAGGFYPGYRNPHSEGQMRMGAVRSPCNEQHPRGSERLYEDFKFWTGIDECETYGVDFLTGNKNTRNSYERIDPKSRAFLRPVHWRRQPNPTSHEYPFVLITGRVVYHFHTRTKTGRSLRSWCGIGKSATWYHLGFALGTGEPICVLVKGFGQNFHRYAARPSLVSRAS